MAALKNIPGYGGKYRIFDDGRVYRRSDSDDYDWEEVAVGPEGSPNARVRLYKPGGGDRPTRRYVREILRDLFGDEAAQAYVAQFDPPE